MLSSAAPVMLDLCCGLMGASAAMRERGWIVTTLDYDPKFGADITADVREWHYTGGPVDLLWMSPPCDEFARESMPWCKTGKAPDMSIVRACLRLVREIKPRYWVLENVRGALPYLGKPSTVVGPFYFWGVFPPLGNIDMMNFRNKESYGSKQPEERAKIPAQIALAFALAVERQPMLSAEYLYAE